MRGFLLRAAHENESGRTICTYLRCLVRLSLGEKLLQAESDYIYKMDKVAQFEFRCTNACGHGCDKI